MKCRNEDKHYSRHNLNHPFFFSLDFFQKSKKQKT